MNNAQAYFKRIDLENQKTVSSKKLKDIITSTIKCKLALMEEASSQALIDMYHDGAHELLQFGQCHLCLYTIDEFNYINDKIWQATTKRMKELSND